MEMTRGAAAKTVPTAFVRVAQLQFEMVCERPPRSLRSRLPLTRGRLCPQHESFILRRRRQGQHAPFSRRLHSFAATRLYQKVGVDCDRLDFLQRNVVLTGKTNAIIEFRSEIHDFAAQF
jgi:hypothetical protein